MRVRHLIDALPLIVIALVIAAISPKFFPLATDAVEDRSDRPKVVTVPEKREQRQVLKVGDGDTDFLQSVTEFFKEALMAASGSGKPAPLLLPQPTT